jgi:hypothetical protein
LAQRIFRAVANGSLQEWFGPRIRQKTADFDQNSRVSGLRIISLFSGRAGNMVAGNKALFCKMKSINKSGNTQFT